MSNTTLEGSRIGEVKYAKLKTMPIEKKDEAHTRSLLKLAFYTYTILDTEVVCFKADKESKYTDSSRTKGIALFALTIIVQL